MMMTPEKIYLVNDDLNIKREWYKTKQVGFETTEYTRTEYEKGRHDVIEKAMVWLTSHMKWGVVSWDDKEECVRSFKEAMKE